MAEKVKFLIIEGGAINRLGHPAWGLVGKLLGVTNETIRQWRKRSGKYYKEEFAKACNEGIAAADAGQVKRWLAKEGVVHEGQTFAAAMAAALKSKDQPKE